MEKTVELKDLVGECVLTGVDRETASLPREYCEGEFEDCETIRFCINGTVYCAIEDPSDGYRSSMRKLIVSDTPIRNSFAPVRVLGHMKPNGYRDNDTIQFRDLASGDVVLEVGTNNSDDYYPSFVSEFNPQNMAINRAGKR